MRSFIRDSMGRMSHLKYGIYKGNIKKAVLYSIMNIIGMSNLSTCYCSRFIYVHSLRCISVFILLCMSYCFCILYALLLLGEIKVSINQRYFNETAL